MRKKHLNIDIDNVRMGHPAASDGEELEAAADMMEPPPPGLSPRSAAEWARTELMEAAKRRREKKRKKKKKGEGKKTKKGEQGRKRKKRRKKKKKRKRKDEEEEELEVVQPPPEDHFYPTPRQLRAKRLAYPVEQNPVKCSICEGVHYRTKRNFAANLKIIMNINAALGTILDEMRGRLRKINGNLNRVKKNLVLMEDTYEGIFRKVNRLIA